jgi:two-component system sensor histidine kinase/response regulator
MIDPSLKNANILIVDDQEANIDVLEGLLEMQGYINIKTTTDPRNVVTLYNSFQPDLILLDLTMPWLSGFEVMDQLKKFNPEKSFLPILVLTADITNDAKIKALSNGASDFLTKPFDLLEVGLRIKNLLFSSYLQQELKNQNKILDIKVKERTQELLINNIELKVAKEKAEASDKLKTSFINNISHEIRTPLNGILGFSQILMDPELQEEEKAQFIHILNESSERLIKTVSNFLEISLISSGNQELNKKDFYPDMVINDVVRHFKTYCQEKEILLITDQPTTIPIIKIHTDSELLLKILKYLMDNAVKFTKSGSITIGYNRKESDLEFFVKDTGKGISDESKKLIFDRFMQEDNSYTRIYEGCGLGLSISKGLVELLGGKIWVESEENKGSTFFFTIPIQQSAQHHIKEIIPEQISNSIKTILVAEDDEINFTYLNILLKDKFTRIIHARNGAEAIELSRAHPEICVFLTDLKMPILDGYQAIKEIKTFRKDLPVIAITAYSGGEDKLRALDAGSDEFITKPVKKEILLEKLAKYGIVIGMLNNRPQI